MMSQQVFAEFLLRMINQLGFSLTSIDNTNEGGVVISPPTCREGRVRKSDDDESLRIAFKELGMPGGR